MPEPERWVIVSDDPENKIIIGGPYLWDGQTQWEPPEQGDLLLEADAVDQGYSLP